MINSFKEYLFVFLWFSFYQVICIISPMLQSVLMNNQYILEILLIIYIFLLLFWIYKKKLVNELAIQEVSINDLNECLWCIPLLSLVAVNMRDCELNMNQLLLYAMIAFIEELFFRGFLLKITKQLFVSYRLLLCGFIFAIFHISNILTYSDYIYVFYQIIISFISGVAFCVITLKCKSLIPSFFIHLLINITANRNVLISSQVEYIICIFIYGMYSLCLYKKYIYGKE